ncbi:MATE family efflux transporter [Mycobacterium sp. 21AC1]|uniref:MATE family efflux transporter n=1 Tax=[Mycobacterium] appelbergii TaxID=2939269 RepID=UPI0029393069|nr:MATE family efflux transporter [Mycobacterium sp. 21AC1]MDV3124819.1 MATE family efflux transporter [Mycobacterium sp. 21AC1]
MTVATAGRELTRLAGPIALTQLAQVALTTTDLVMMGPLGVAALAAGGLSITLFNQLRTMGVGLLTSVGNLVSSAVSRAEHAQSDDSSAIDDVRGLVRASLLVATVAGIIGGLLLVGLGYVLRWLGQDAAVLDGTLPMLAALAPGLVPCLWFQVVRQYTVGMRRPKALLLITLASVALNVALNAVLIYGPGPLPALGLPGIGAATSVVYLLTFVAFATMVRADPELSPYFSLAMHRAPLPAVREILRLGVPIAGTYGSEAGLFSVTAIVIGTFGAPALAAHAVVNQLSYIVFQVSVGISHGASILLSRLVELGEAARTRLIARLAYGQGACVAALVAAIYAAVPTPVLGLFMDTSDRAALAIATSLLVVAAFQQFVDSAQNIGIGLLRGLHDTSSSFLITIVGYWVVGFPVGLLLAYAAGLKTIGMWLGLSAGLTTAAIMLFVTFRRRLAAATAEP